MKDERSGAAGCAAGLLVLALILLFAFGIPVVGMIVDTATGACDPHTIVGYAADGWPINECQRNNNPAYVYGTYGR